MVSLTFALILSPPDYLQGNDVRIMYVHVPSAWIGLASYSVMAFLSIINSSELYLPQRLYNLHFFVSLRRSTTCLKCSLR